MDAILIELTAPREEGLEAVYERKNAKCADLVAEVGARGFVARSTSTPAQGPGSTVEPH